MKSRHSMTSRKTTRIDKCTQTESVTIVDQEQSIVSNISQTNQIQNVSVLSNGNNTDAKVDLFRL